MKNKNIVLIFAILSMFFGLIGLILSFLPLGLISLIPAIIGLVFWFIAYLIKRKTEVKSKIIFVAITLSILAILITGFSEIFIQDKVIEDLKFNEKIEQSKSEAIDDLEDALEDIEMDSIDE